MTGEIRTPHLKQASQLRTSAIHVLPVFPCLVLGDPAFCRSPLVVLHSFSLGGVESGKAHQLHHLLFLITSCDAGGATSLLSRGSGRTEFHDLVVVMIKSQKEGAGPVKCYLGGNSVNRSHGREKHKKKNPAFREDTEVQYAQRGSPRGACRGISPSGDTSKLCCGPNYSRWRLRRRPGWRGAILAHA